MQTYSFGAAVFIIREDAILLTHRIKGAQLGVWEVPAGHIEGDETAQEAAARELLEETGLMAVSLRSMGEYVNDQYRYKASMFLVEAEGEPENLDERNHSALEWHQINELPANLGATTRSGLRVLGLIDEA